MPEDKSYRLYLEEKFEGMQKVQHAYFREMHDRFDTVDQSNKIRNSRIEKNEKNRCWAFANGYHYLTDVSADGFKWGFANTSSYEVTLINSISVYNRNNGYNDNARGSGNVKFTQNVYNNIFYKNGLGILLYDVDDTYSKTITFKNNITYDNTTSVTALTTYVHEYNSWDTPPGVTITDGTFLSVDSAGLAGARNAWGGLPILTFLHLDDDVADGVGVNVGLTYDGDSLYHNIPPDLGPFAYSAVTPEPPEYPQVTTTVTSYSSVRAIVTGTGIDDGGGTVSAKGICWDTSTNPAITDNIVPAGSGTDDFSCTLIVPANTTIYISAYVTNETITAYGAVVQIDTPLTSPVLDDSGNPMVDDSGNIIIQ